MEFFTTKSYTKTFLKKVKSNYAKNKNKKTSNLCKCNILEIMSKA